MIFGYSNEGLAGQSTQDNRPVSAIGPMLKASPTGNHPNTPRNRDQIRHNPLLQLSPPRRRRPRLAVHHNLLIRVPIPRRAITVRATGGWQFRIRHNARTERRQASRAQRWKTSTGAACDLSGRALPRGGVGILKD